MSDIEALIKEISEQMHANGAEFVFEIVPGGNPDVLAFGFVLRRGDGGFITGEIGLDGGGRPQITVSSYDGDGELTSPTVLDVGGSMIIVP